MNPTPQQIAAAEALFDRSEPKGLTSAEHPFHRWCDSSQREAIKIVVGLGLA